MKFNEIAKLNKIQFIGMGIVLVGVIGASLNESALIGIPSGFMSAVGAALILKIIPLKKK